MTCLSNIGVLFRRRPPPRTTDMKIARDAVINRELAKVRAVSDTIKKSAAEITESANRIASIVEAAQRGNDRDHDGSAD